MTTLAEFFRTLEETRDVPAFVTAALGTIAAVLVGSSTFAALETGYPAIGLSFLAAVVLFLGAVAVFEIGRRFGSA